MMLVPTVPKVQVVHMPTPAAASAQDESILLSARLREDVAQVTASAPPPERSRMGIKGAAGAGAGSGAGAGAGAGEGAGGAMGASSLKRTAAVAVVDTPAAEAGGSPRSVASNLTGASSGSRSRLGLVPSRLHKVDTTPRFSSSTRSPTSNGGSGDAIAAPKTSLSPAKPVPTGVASLRPSAVETPPAPRPFDNTPHEDRHSPHGVIKYARSRKAAATSPQTSSAEVTPTAASSRGGHPANKALVVRHHTVKKQLESVTPTTITTTTTNPSNNSKVSERNEHTTASPSRDVSSSVALLTHVSLWQPQKHIVGSGERGGKKSTHHGKKEGRGPAHESGREWEHPRRRGAASGSDRDMDPHAQLRPPRRSYSKRRVGKPGRSRSKRGLNRGPQESDRSLPHLPSVHSVDTLVVKGSDNDTSIVRGPNRSPSHRALRKQYSDRSLGGGGGGGGGGRGGGGRGGGGGSNRARKSALPALGDRGKGREHVALHSQLARQTNGACVTPIGVLLSDCTTRC